MTISDPVGDMFARIRMHSKEITPMYWYLHQSLKICTRCNGKRGFYSWVWGD